jgi:Nitroreductase family
MRMRDHELMPTLPLTPDELLTTTRSVRKRLDLTRDVPIDLVRECLEVALQAPSGSNKQGWHWMVITDENSRLMIGNYYRQAVASYLKSSGSAATLFPDDQERNAVQRRVGDSVAYLGEHMGEVPVLVIPCVRAPRLSAGSQAGLWGSLLRRHGVTCLPLAPAGWAPLGRRCICGTKPKSPSSSGFRPTFGKASSSRPPTTPATPSGRRRVSRWTTCSTSTPGSDADKSVIKIR